MSRKTIYLAIICGIIFLLAVIALLYFFRPPEKPDSTAKIATPKTSGIPVEQSQNKIPTSRNLLVNPQDSVRIQNSTKTSEPVTRKNFTFTLSPLLVEGQPNKNSDVTPVLGAINCSISGSSNLVSVYKLYKHITDNKAKDISSSWGITGNVTSLQGDLGFQYKFSTDDSKEYVIVSEASGQNIYHLSPARYLSTGTALQPSEIGTRADLLIEEKRLLKVPGGKTVEEINTGGQQLTKVSYYENAFEYGVIDAESLAQNGDSSICNAKPALSGNALILFYSKYGEVVRADNTVRHIQSKVTLTRLPLEDAVAAYAANPPFEPIVIPPDPALNTGNVTIEEASLVYYDTGRYVPQSNYVPMYLLSGHIDATRVITVIPAVGEADMAAKGLVVANPISLAPDQVVQPSQPSQQNDTLSIPDNPPPPTASPFPTGLYSGTGTTTGSVSSTPQTTTGGSIAPTTTTSTGGSSSGTSSGSTGSSSTDDGYGGTSAGGQKPWSQNCPIIDVEVVCVDSTGATICTDTKMRPSFEDPAGICTNGPKSLSGNDAKQYGNVSDCFRNNVDKPGISCTASMTPC